MTTEIILSGTSWTPPSGVTSVTVHAIGGGGAGGAGDGSNGGSGGGGGAYASGTVSVTAGVAVSIQIGAAGGTAGADGTDTWFKSTSDVMAKGGQGGGLNSTAVSSTISQGGQASASVGTTKFNGGDGGVVQVSGNDYGGGGGGAAGPNGAGGSGGVGATAASGGGGGADGGTSASGVTAGSPGGGTGSATQGAATTGGSTDVIWTDNSGGAYNGTTTGPGGGGAGATRSSTSFGLGGARGGGGGGGGRSSNPTFRAGSAGVLVLEYTAAGGGGDVSVSLTGQSMTSSRGSLAVDHTNALTGQAVTSARGTLTPDNSVLVALTGLGMTSARGSLAVDHANVLTGHSLTVSEGTLTPVIGRLPVAALTDDFESGTLDTGKWVFSNTADFGTPTSGDYDITGGKLRLKAGSLNPGESDSFITSVDRYTLVGSRVYARVEINNNSDKVEFGIQVIPGDGALMPYYNYIGATINADVFYNIVSDNGNFDHIDTDPVWSPTNHAWLSLREESGSLIWEGAPNDGGSPGTWTQISTYDLTNLATFSVDDVKFRFMRRNVGTLASLSDGIASFDAVNATAQISDINVALTGQALTSARGTLAVDHTNALTGLSATTARGTAGVDHTQALTGQSLTTARGTVSVTADGAIALTGLSMTASRGTLGVDRESALTGLSVTSAPGAPGVTHTNPLTGLSVTSARGTVSPGSDISMGLTGLSMTSARGTLGVVSGSSIGLTGLSMTGSVGTLSPENVINVALTGLSMTSARGSLGVTHTNALTGRELSLGRGSLTVSTGNKSVALTGLAMTAKAGYTSHLRLDPVQEIKNLRINSGTYTGGYIIAPAGRLQWYFTNLALIQCVPYLSPADLDFYVRVYLDLYLTNLDLATFAINDVDTPTTTPVLLAPDSHDAYAGTFLHLAVLYVQRSKNTTWWNTNLATFKNIAFQNMAAQQKPSGLFKVFQTGGPNDIGYLMDACECYSGLRLFADELAARGDADATYYDAVAGGAAAGINGLWDPAALAYRFSDNWPTATTEFYAGAVCQVFPRLHAIPTESEARFDNAAAWLNTWAPNWFNGTYDAFPWMPLAAAARINGETTNALNHRLYADHLWQENRALLTINELGWMILAAEQPSVTLLGLNVTATAGTFTPGNSNVGSIYNGGVSGFWLDAKPISNFESLDTGGSVLSAYGNNYGKWLDLSPNGNHAVEPVSGNRGFATNSTWRYYANTFDDLTVPNAGGSTTRFYFAAALGLSTYYGTIYSERGTSTSNNGLRIYHNADGVGSNSVIGFCAGSAADHVDGYGDPNANAASQVVMPLGTQFVNPDPNNVFVLECWYDGTYLWGSINGATPTRSTNPVTITVGRHYGVPELQQLG